MLLNIKYHLFHILLNKNNNFFSFLFFFLLKIYLDVLMQKELLLKMELNNFY